MSVEENKAIAHRWNDEVWSKGRLAAIDELFASDFVFNYPAPRVAPNREGYKQTMTIWRTPFANVHCIIEDMVAEGDKVAVRWTWSGTHTGEYMGVAPTGKEVTVTGISVLRIVGGKIVEEWGEMDNLGFLQQVSVFPPPR